MKIEIIITLIIIFVGSPLMIYFTGNTEEPNWILDKEVVKINLDFNEKPIEKNKFYVIINEKNILYT